MKKRLIFPALLAAAITTLSLASAPSLQTKGYIEGYVTPNEVKSIVELVIKKGASDTDTSILRTTTDEKGFYKFEGLEDGVYELQIWPRSGDYISKTVTRVVNTKAKRSSVEKADTVKLQRAM